MIRSVLESIGFPCLRSRLLVPLFFFLIGLGSIVAGPGGIVPASDPALPSAYQFREYRYPEPDDAKACAGMGNISATLGKIFFAQTHVMDPAWDFFFLIAGRPALIQVIVTGSGASPDVSVEGFIQGASIGRLCLRGPATLPAALSESAIATPGFDDRFSATLPASWMRPGLSLEVKAGAASRTIAESELKLGAAPEINLIMLPFDVLDWNEGKPDIDVPESFLGDFAGAMPASVIRLGHIASRMSLPTLVVSSSTDVVPVVLQSGSDTKGIPDMSINAAALRFVEAFKHASGDYAYAYYYGNTENFFPGGWGGDKSFVGADFKGIFLHEMGHGLSLPHWGEGAFQNTNPSGSEYRYPYGGTTNDGGGRGEHWNYYQDINEFVSPICGLKDNPEFGKERSDAMQRTHWCEEMRSAGRGPWDGFGDFSAYAMYRFMVGAENEVSGSVSYKGTQAPYHLSKQAGYPTLKLDANGNRVLERSLQPAAKQDWERLDFLVPRKWDTPVYSIYGSYHPSYKNADILYDPMAYVGNLPRVIDPTDPAVFADLTKGASGPYGDYFYWEKDLTFKFTYADGTVLHALYPYSGVSRDWQAEASPWRADLQYFVLNIPADKKLARIELYKRPFVVRGSNAVDAGNIANPALGITAQNFMDGAVLVMSRNVDVNPPANGIAAGPVRGKQGLRYRMSSDGVEFLGLAAGSSVEIYDARGSLIARRLEQAGRAEWNGTGSAQSGAGAGSSMRGIYWADARDARGARVQRARLFLP